MAHLLGAEHVSVSFATRTVLDDVTLGLDEGDRVGMVGRNGDGKSTLMRLLAQRQTPDSGRVTHRGGLRVGYLDQQDVLDPDWTVRYALVGDAEDHEWASDARIRDIMNGLVAELDLGSRVGTLSGGQRRRVALARLLAGDHDVIMLDEPTNHLDIEGVAWLAQHIKKRWRANDGALLVVTHDRWFLDEVCTLTWEVHDGVVDHFDGGYAAYVLARAERDRMASVVENKRQQLMKKELAWLRRGAPARTSKPKFRIEAANEIISDVPDPRDSVSLRSMATARLGKDVFDAEDISLTLSGKTIFDNVTLRLAPGERIGVVGVNGAGKSSLLRLFSGEIEPDSGRIRRGKTVVPAVLTQEVRELDELKHLRVIEVIQRERQVFEIGGKEVSAGQLVEQLGFTREKQWTRVSELSGGERRRLQLLRLLVGEPNVLMLDEPTNDLDTDTLAAVEDVLDSWPGTLVVVSHDRYLLERVTDHQVALLGDGKIRGLPGGVDQYLQLRNEMEGVRAGSGSLRVMEGDDGAAGLNAAGSGAPASADAPKGGPSEAERRQARKDAAKLERQIAKTEAAEAKLHAELAELATGSDYEAINRVNAELRATEASREELELQWLEALETAGD
ncbi:ABC-F family ATP-binding cassette domain-containing protein [Falsarthrobacter nasiphocae]|uniref:ATPase subunit of ABC transporter with duplicated ATPase domains n=1 Tax=Falsarthrobacter nasiphocae TaxID=189863 RepID=A0AAE4C6M4_9MICC|nr:ABC-F family ATP-binding cassette domain-containing protein [Falsarthrobacter nasiphocae]MDR6891609.1 ATPase subunit of ABC transporter with duplicated ATPase domains [Falsarthrobacter nasiphocae]